MSNVQSAQLEETILDQTTMLEIIEDWIERFRNLIEHPEVAEAQTVFLDNGNWRDLLALTWDIRSAIGIEDIQRMVRENLVNRGFEEFSVQFRRPPEVVDYLLEPGRESIEAYLAFENQYFKATALVRLVEEGGEWLAGNLCTNMAELKNFPDNATTWANAADRDWTQAIKGRPTWEDGRDPNRKLPKEPTVLIIGGSQSGLNLAARLDRYGVDYVVIEQHKRLGDSWRKRYNNLKTHTVSFGDQFAYLPFPANWPLSMSAQKLAAWIESYAHILDLNVWTNTAFEGGEFDQSTNRWNAVIRTSSGSTEIIRPKHLVYAVGNQGRPFVPDFPGMDKFTGEIVHSSEYGSGHTRAGKRVVVVGSGASGHGIAQDLWEQGAAEVTMVQRSSTMVISYDKTLPVMFGRNYDVDTHIDDADLKFLSLPHPVSADFSATVAPALAELDRELLDGLNAAGFHTNLIGFGVLAFGPTSSGYYINQGASDLIVAGEIKVKHGEVVAFDENHVIFRDGSRMEADSVVLSTGYGQMRDAVRESLGDDIADRLEGDAWVMDHSRGGEHGLFWRNSGVPQLWFMGASFQDARIYGNHLAMRIKAIEAGISCDPMYTRTASQTEA
jgi:putative flavoprotein involved in K+ transport